jgi:P4 family phage/plasmid primase-like protien
MAVLWEAVCRLAVACGCRPREEKKVKARSEPNRKEKAVSVRSEERKAPPSQLAERLRKGEEFVKTCPPARSGKGGHDTTFRVARRLRNDLALPDEEGRCLLGRYNERLTAAGEQPWTDSELDHKWESAAGDNPDFPYGGAARAAPVPANDPHRLARSFLGGRRWVCWNGLYFEHDGAKYREAPERELRALLTAHVRRLLDEDHAEQVARYASALARYEQARQDLTGAPAGPRPGRAPVPLPVNRSLVGNTLQAFESLCTIRGDVPMNSLLPEGRQEDRLALANGLLDPDEGALRPHTPDWFSTVCLPFAYEPAARCARWLEVLGRNLEGDGGRIALLQEFFGYCLVRSTDAQVCLVLVGEGGNGKSVALAALQAVLGDGNVSTVPLEDFGRRFAMVQTLGKLANVCAEVGELDRTAEGTLKSYVSGDRMTFEWKGKDAFTARPTARLVLSTNNVPRFADKSEGVWRRLLLVPFNRRVPEGERVHGMDKPEWWVEQREAAGIFNWALEGLRRLRANGMRFTVPAVCRAALDEHRRDSDPARDFLLQHYVADEKARPFPSRWLYKTYLEWCEENGHKYRLSANTFGKQVRRVFGSADSRPHRCEPGENGVQKAWFGLRPRGEVTGVTAG